MVNTQTFNIEAEQDPNFLVWAKTGRAIELIWTGNNILLALYQLIKAKAKYKKLVKLEWI